MEHLEGFIDVAAKSLRDSFNTRILAINGEHSDFALEPVADGNFVPGGVDTIHAYPLVEIAAPDFTLSNPDVMQHGWDGDFVLMARCWYAHPVYDVLYRSLMRYGRALCEVLAKKDALGQGVTVSNIRGSYRTNPEQNSRESYEGGALVILSFQTVELVP